jgi:hypothetical protein
VSFSVLALAIAGLIIVYNYRENSVAALGMADRLMESASNDAINSIEALLAPVDTLVAVSPSLPDIADKPNGMAHPAAALLMQALERYDYLYSVYLAYGDGDFYARAHPFRHAPHRP